RVFAGAVIVLFGIVVGGSMSARSTIVETFRANRALAVATVGFLVTLFISTFTSINIGVSTEQVFNAILNWYVVLFACLIAIRNEDDIIVVLKVIVIAGILVSWAGVVEFAFERRFFLDALPKSILDPLIENNPAVRIMYEGSPYRDGLYRA